MKRKSLYNWFRATHFWDSLWAFAEGGFWKVRAVFASTHRKKWMQLLGHSPSARLKSRPFVPSGEQLEARLVMNHPVSAGTGFTGPSDIPPFQNAPFAATKGIVYSGEVGSFFDLRSTAHAASYAATIDWGDGTKSRGIVSGPGGVSGFQVSGTHTYERDGDFRVRITANLPNRTKATATNLAQVTDTLLNGYGVRYSSPVDAYDDTLGYFTDGNPQDQLSNFVATIDWGDGTSSSGIVAGQHGSFNVSGQHTYGGIGTYDVTVSVQDLLGNTTSWTTMLCVGNTELVGSVWAVDPTVDANEGEEFSADLGSFTDTNADSSTITIYWGDGTSDSDAQDPAVDGTYYVSGTHTYQEEGSYSIVIKVSPIGGGSEYTVITDTADVSDPSPVWGDNAYIFATEGTSTGTVFVGSFTDPGDPTGTIESASDYSATIAWGDGTTSAGTVTATGGGGYDVDGSHTYTSEPAPSQITVTISHDSSSGLSIGDSLAVTDPPVSASGVTPAFKTIDGVDTGSVTVATFTDPGDPTGTVEPLGDYSATIDWGDGSPTSSGTITKDGTTYSVTGDHTFTDDYTGEAGAATYTISVTIYHDSSTPQVVNDTADFKLPVVSYSASNYYTTEPDGVTTPIGTATITVNLTSPYDGSSVVSEDTVTVEYCNCNGDIQAMLDAADTQQIPTANQDAIPYIDYIPTSGILTIPAGNSSGTYTIPILTDFEADGNEDVHLQLSNPINATLPGGPNEDKAKAILTIQDNSSEGTTYTYDSHGNLISEVFPGDPPTRTWMRDGTTEQVTAYSDELGHTTYYTYDSAGNLQTIVDALGETTTYAYNAEHEVTSVTSPTPAGSLTAPVTQYAYDTEFRLTQIINPDSSARTYTYDDNGNILTETNELGQTTTNEYDSNNLLTAVIDPTGATTLLAYDSDGRVTAITDPLGRETDYAYDDDGRISTVTVPGPQTTTYAYDSNGAITSVIDANGLTTTNIYNADGRISAVVNPDGFTTTYAYDDVYHTVTVTDPFGRTAVSTRDARGNLVSQTDALNQTTLYEYDVANELTAVIDPLGHTALYSYDALGRQTSVVDAFGNTTGTQYDPAGNIIATVDALGATTTYVFDLEHRPIQTIDALGHTSTTDYDAAGRVTATIDALSHTILQQYDAAGRVTATIDALGHTTINEYDADGEVTASVDALGQTTVREYDGAGNITATIDPVGGTTLQMYDTVGHLTEQVDADGHASYQDYDSTGLLLDTVDANGNTTYYDYDSNRRLTATIDASGFTMQQVYDDYGNVTGTIDGNGSTSYQFFDANGNVTASVDANGNTAHTYYDPDGLVTATVDAAGATSLQYYDLDNRLTATVDPNGHTSLTMYDANSNVTATVDANGHTSHQYFDADNRVTASVDPLGHTVFTSYDAVGNVTAMIDADSNTSLAFYDAANQMTAMADGLGHTSYACFDPAGNVTATVDANGTTSLSYFDSNNQVTATVDGNGVTTFTQYDAVGNVTATIDGNGNTTLQYYDADNQPTATVDAIGNTTFQYYDGDGRGTESIDYIGNTTFQFFDGDGQLTAYVDGNGVSNSAMYDAAGNMTASVDGNGVTLLQYFDSNNQMTATVDGNGATMFTQYDAVGNVTATISGNGNTTLQYYDADNQLTATVDGVGNTAFQYYDSDGQLTQMIDVHGHTTKQTYDADGNVTQTIDVTGHTSHQYFDADNRLTESIDAVGNTTYQQYDANGNVTAAIDGDGNTTQQLFDADGRVTATIDGNGATTFYAFDNNGNRTAVIDSVGNTTTMAFDADGRVTQTIMPTGGTVLQSYDADGNVTESVAATGSSILYAYDKDDRQTQQLWYDASHSLVDTQNRTYDNNGVLATASNTNGTYTFSYDADGRLTSVAEPFGVSLDYAYDGDGNQTQVIDSFGGTQTSVYDVENRLVTREYVGQSQQLRADYTYNAQGLIATLIRYNSTSGPAYLGGNDVVAETDSGYDADGNVTSILSYDSLSTTIDQFAYTYDHAGNLSSETDTQQGTATTTTYGYDADNQLTSAGGSNYSYDANGNRTGGSYATTTGNEMSADASWTYSYDASGNLTEKDTTAPGSSEHWTYAYDPKNELVQAKHYDSNNTLVFTIAYAYDVFGNLIEEDATSGGTVTTKFALDGWNPNLPAPIGNENFNAWAVLDGTGSLTSRYVWSDQTSQQLGRIDVGVSSNTTYWVLADHLGSVRDVIDNTGTAQDSIAYDGFGIITAETSASARGLYGYTGSFTDNITGLQLHSARWYDPTTGKWLSQDPIGFAAGDANLYRYVDNHPTTSVDTSGLDEISTTGQVDSTVSWVITPGNTTVTPPIGKVIVAGGTPETTLVSVSFSSLPDFPALSGNVTLAQLRALASYENNISGMTPSAQRGYIWTRLQGLGLRGGAANPNAVGNPQPPTIPPAVQGAADGAVMAANGATCGLIPGLRQKADEVANSSPYYGEVVYWTSTSLGTVAAVASLIAGGLGIAGAVGAGGGGSTTAATGTIITGQQIAAGVGTAVLIGGAVYVNGTLVSAPTVIGAGGAALSTLPANSLTASEVAQIQAIANRYNTTIDVVGSRAEGNGQNITSNLPMRDQVPRGQPYRSDIDFRIDAAHPQVNALIADLKSVSNNAGSAGLQWSTNPATPGGRPTDPPYIRFAPR